MAHKAAIVEGSIENLGANGIAFSIECCGDPKTRERHTIVHAHTLSTMELQDIVERQYLRRIEATHGAAETNFNHLMSMSKPDLTDCENCK